MKRKYILECADDDEIVFGYLVLDLKSWKFDRISSFKEEATALDFNEIYRYKKMLYKHGFKYRLLIEEIGKEKNEYPEIPGYTLHGDYYLADEVIPNKTWEQACKMAKIVVLPNGKIVIAHTLLEEELETILQKERGNGKKYWTSTPYNSSYNWIVAADGSFDFNSCIGNNSYAIRLGFKNPFLKEEPKESKGLTYSEINSVINEVMDSFDYKRVRKAMNLLDWKWFGKGIPKIYDLRVESRKLLEEAANKVAEGKEYYFVATGGFKAEAWKNDDDTLGLRLNFILEDSEN